MNNLSRLFSISYPPFDKIFGEQVSFYFT